MSNEIFVGEVQGNRKVGSERCAIKVSVCDGQTCVTAIDKSGVTTLAAMLSNESADALIGHLQKARTTS